MDPTSETPGPIEGDQHAPDNMTSGQGLSGIGEDLDRNVKPGLCIMDLQLQCAIDGSNFSSFNSVKLVIFGSAVEEGKGLSLQKESPKTWKHTLPVDLKIDADSFKIVATSEELMYFAFMTLTKYEFLSGLETRITKSSANEADVPALTLSFLVNEIPQGAQIQESDDEVLTLAWELFDRGIELMEHYECTGNLPDISEAISIQQRAVQLTPNDHPDMPAILNNLGVAFQSRLNV